jgi:hypothetical protein
MSVFGDSIQKTILNIKEDKESDTEENDESTDTSILISNASDFYSRKRFITYFTDYINEPNKLKRKKYKKMILSLYDSISETRLDIDILNRFADFIKDSEYFFFYDNSNNNTCYSPRSGINGYTNGFVINTDNAKIITNINLENNKICIEIQRKAGDKYKTTISFYNKVFTKLTDEEYLLLLVVSKEIVKQMKSLICGTYNLATHENLLHQNY